jgi:protein O-GlcNAc transferase
MSDVREQEPQTRARLFINLGSGPKGAAWLPAMFTDWRELRVDADPRTAPDLLADIADLSAIESESADAVWSAHCFEHLYLHQIGAVVSEVHRILAPDGFFCLLVPDMQTIAEFIAGDRMSEVLYQSPAGPVTAHDIIYGFGPYIAQGRDGMAHRCGFTPGVLMSKLREAPFAEIMLRRRPLHELAAVATKRSSDEASRSVLLAALEL